MQFLKRIGSALKALGGLVLPMFARTRDVRNLSPALRWTLHAVLFALVLLGLWGLNLWFGIGQYLKVPRAAPWLRDVWLPLLFLLIYMLSWLGWWLWHLLGPEQEALVFPDIDQAWNEALRALDQAGIDLTESPLFLVLGHPRSGEDALFQGARLRLQVTQAPRGSEAPMHVFANRDGIYVTCAGASILGRQASVFAEDAEVGEAAGVVAPPSGQEGESFATYIPERKGRDAQALQQVLIRARDQGRSAAQLSGEEHRAIGLLAADRDDVDNPTGLARWSLQRNRAEVEVLSARLQHLCRLIVRHRRPYCPLNGILVLVPMAATGSDEDASQVGQVIQKDLAVVRETMQVQCPVFAMVCELETLPGFRELIERLPEDQHGRRVGMRFPLVPDLPPSGLSNMIESGVRWVGLRLFPNLVDGLWTIETSGQESSDDAIQGNVRLYRLLCQVRDRQPRLARLLTRAAFPEGAPRSMLGGCYLAGTGLDAAHEQAFIAGVFRRLTDSQDFVSWTEEALADEAFYNRWTLFGYVGIVLFTTVCVILAALLLSRY